MTPTDMSVDAPDVVVVDHVSKHFTIRRDNSLKERIVTLGRRGKAHREVFDSLKDVSLTIRAGTTIGLMGPNGSGKSTLLKTIGGIIEPSSGSVLRRGRLAALLELGAGFHPDLSGRDNVYLNASILGLSREQTDAEFDSIVAFSEIGDFIDTQVKFYSSGMYVRLAFAVAVHTDPDVLLVDEVLAVGDEAFQRKCMDKIREFQRDGRTIILVSHSASQVMEVCDEGVVLHEGEVAFIGTAADATKVHRDILEGRRRETLEQEAPKEEAEDLPAITGITVRMPDDEAGMLAPGGALEVSVGVKLPVALDTWNTSISIDTPHGQQVFGTGSKRLSGPHGPTPAGDATITYSFPHLSLAGGSYFVNAVVANAEGEHFDVLWQGATFAVPYTERQTGTVFSEARVSES
ncbi:ABC transporter ATP-binding protein [Microbacterium sp.]|uniref:ABC transporter ATP-binding protein n=1 Tax=Microbacterium sp. TaxID=51671 RepID=UPI00257CF24A|nr:ABC transporter ATP-binding protein [Microbacterium sp.]